MRISFIGDVSFTGNFGVNVIDDSKSSNILSPEIMNLFSKSDYTVCNLEGPLTSKKCIKSTKLNVKSPIKSLSFLLDNKINIFGLANNHMFDAGYAGFNDTKNALNKNNAIYFGAGDNIEEASKITYIDKQGVVIALIGVGHNVGDVANKTNFGIFSYTNEEELKKRILEAKKNADWVVLFYHTGPEYNFYPTPVVRERLIKTLEFGADIIIAHHPHTMQGIETFKNSKTIVYSLGNFIFDLKSMRNKKNYNIGLITTINFKKNEYKMMHQPIVFNPIKGNVKFADNKFINKLKKISDFSNYNTKIVNDSLRVLFANPILPSNFNFKFLIYLVFLPLIKIYKVYITSGFDAEYVDIILQHYKITFLKNVLKGNDNYKHN